MNILRILVCIICALPASALCAHSEIPNDIWYEIISNTSDPDAFGEAVRTLMQTNTEMAEYVTTKSAQLIDRCASRFGISPLAAALFIGTSSACEYYSKRITQAKKNDRTQLLEDILRYYSGSPSSVSVLKKALESGVEIKKKYSTASDWGTVVPNGSGEHKLECFSAPQSPRRRSSTWGINGSSIILGGIPWSIAVDADSQLVVLGTRPKQSVPEHELFIQTVSGDGTSCESPISLGTFSTTLVPLQVSIQPHTHNRVCILSQQHAQNDIHILLVSKDGVLVSQELIRPRRQNRMKSRPNSHFSRENVLCSFQEW